MIQQSQVSRLFLTVLLFCFTFFIPRSVFSQSIVNVNNLTGTANATIPIYNVTVGDLSAPVALSYSASGLKVENYDNSFGQGWRLIASAAITREVRGFPDDVEYQSDASYSVIKGWLKSGNAAPQTIQSLSFANVGTSNCDNEITDATTIANNFSYTYDTEPDYFNISAPGLSCSFVFDGTTNHVIRTIPYRDYQITPTLNWQDKIIAFTVINENGIKYSFGITHFNSKSVDIFNPGTTVAINPSTLEVFKRDFMMYRNKADYAGYPLGYPVMYMDEWVLTNMEDTRGNKITYNYSANTYLSNNPVIHQKNSYKEIEIVKPDGSIKKLYGITTLAGKYRLESISTFSLGVEPLQAEFGPSSTYSLDAESGSSQIEVEFNWGGAADPYDDDRLLGITLPVGKKKYELLYTTRFLASPTVWNSYGRYYLIGLKAYGTSGLCSNVNTQFDFTYYAVDQASNTCYCTPLIPGTSTKLDTLINAQDYWGYYNGKVSNADLIPKIYVYPDNPPVELFKVYAIPGYSGSQTTLVSSSERTVTPRAVDGSLRKITYPTGATTELLYENNEFFDNDVNGNVPGGGIRIKEITNNDGLGTVDVTEYSYNDLTYTSVTTGRAISVPKFAIVFQNTTSYSTIADRVKYSTYRTTYDLNNEPKDILYGKVTIKKTGIGKSVYEYNTDGTFGSSPVTDWNESKNYVARTNLSSPTPCTAIAPSFLYVNNAALQYPFTSNANYDFERGLPTKVTHYNEAGGVVAEEQYTYDRSHTNPEKVYGVKLDEIGTTMAAYSKYGLNTIVDNFLITKKSKLYNSGSSTPIEDVETYEYTPKSSSLTYRLLKSVSKQNSGDPATTFSRFKYSKEYAATSTTGNEMNEAIYHFNSNTVNKNVLIETTQSREESGQPDKFTGGSFNTFKKFTVGVVSSGGTTVDAYLPHKSYQFVNQAGVTGFTSSTITSNAFVWDNTNYINAPSTIEQYSRRGIPQVISDNSHIPKTMISSNFVNGAKFAEFINAKPENIAFSNFDSYDPVFGVSMGGNYAVAGGRYSNYCLNFQPGTNICKSIEKQSTAQNVVISFWLKDATTSGTIYLCHAKFGCGSGACASNPIVSFTSGTQWKYYQVIVPWTSGSTATTYRFMLSTSTAVKLDDILIYPDNTSPTVYSYTSNTIGTNMLTAKTGVNGIGNSYEYDKAGRLWLVRDQFDNIIEMKKYKLPNRHAQQIPSIDIGYNYQHYVVGVSGTFTASPPFSYETGDCEAPPIVYTWDFGDGTGPFTSYGSGSRGLTTINHTYTSTGKKLVTVTASSPGMTNVVAYTPPVTNTTYPMPVEVDASAPSCSSSGTPVICASGIIQYTSTGTCIQTSCSPLPNTCNDTYFKLIDISGGALSNVAAVTWETAPLGTSSWSTYQAEVFGTGGFITSQHFNTVHTLSYQMRAKIRFCNGSYVNSNVITVTNGD